MKKIVCLIAIVFVFLTNPVFGLESYNYGIYKAVCDILKSIKYQHKLQGKKIAVHGFRDAITKEECKSFTISLADRVSNEINALKDLMDIDFENVTRRGLEAIEDEELLSSDQGIWKSNVISLLGPSDILITGYWTNRDDSFELTIYAKEKKEKEKEYMELASKIMQIKKAGLPKDILVCLKQEIPLPQRIQVSQDGDFILFDNGIVQDTRTRIEWMVGPDKDTAWNQANAWVQSLPVDGGGWRLPTMEELKAIYRKKSGTLNMPSLMQTTGWLVWSGETAGNSSAWIFNFVYGVSTYEIRGKSESTRAFAVRSRR